MKSKNSFWTSLSSRSAVLGVMRPFISSRALPCLLLPLAASLTCTNALAQAVPPATFTQTATSGATSLTINFKLHSVRSSNFAVFTQGTGGTLTSVSTDVARTYLGTVTGRPGAIAAGLRKSDGTVWYKIIFEDGTGWESQGGTPTTFGSATWTPAYPSSVVPSSGAGSTVYAAEIGVDVSNRYYVDCGSNTADTLLQIEWNMIKVNSIYLRDAAILQRIGRVIIRSTSSADPYAAMSGDTNAMLGEIKNQWNNVLPASTHDLAMLADTSAYAGLAWVGAVASVNRYGVSSPGPGNPTGLEAFWRHEAGHNWGSNHYEGGGKPEGPTIMSDNSLARFSSPELAKIIAHRNTVTASLDNMGTYSSYPLPPRANADRSTVIPGSTTAITFDVLANDSDSNGQTLTIPSFGTTSANGGTITRSVGTGPGGRDRLIYTPPAGMTTLDTFNYRIQDSAGYQAIAKVYILPLPSPGTYSLKNVTTGLGLDGMGYTTAPSNMGMYAFNGVNNQRFVLSYSGDYVKLKSITGNLYMDSLGATATGAPIGQNSLSASTNQEWKMEYMGSGIYRFTNRANGKAMDSYGLTTNGSAPNFYTANDGGNQQWILAPA
ncbi:hypothetical protein EON83_18580 [bacterium]|nr:MAG: hypothetical protein EON83_18580 [bacterium]